MVFMCKKAASTLLALLLPIALVYAQLSDIKFRHLDVHNGLPSDIVTSIVKDSTGYIWVGTKNGLCRYDGTRFQVFKNQVNDSHSLRSNSILSLVVARHNQLWIGTDKGICRYNYRTNKFYHLTIPNAFPQKINTPSKILLLAKSGRIWFYEYECRALIGYDPEQNNFTQLDFFAKDGGDPVFSMYEDISGDYWISRLHYFYHYYTKTGTFDKILNPRRVTDPADPFIITRFLQGADSIMWMTSWGGGLERFQINTQITDHYLVEPTPKLSGIKNILDCPIWIPNKTNGGTLLWMVSEYGLANFDTGTRKFTIYPPDIYDPYSNKLAFTVSNFPGSYYDEAQNILWCWGPYGIDICDFNSQSIQTFRTLSEHSKIKTGSSEAFANNQFNKDEYFIGNFVSDKIYIYNESSRTIKERQLPFKQGISGIFQPDSAILWMTAGRDIWQWNLKTNAIVNINALTGKDSFAKNAVVISYFKDNNGIIWIGTNGEGMCRYDPTKSSYWWINKNSKDIPLSTDLPTNINSFATSNNGGLYALDRIRGIYKIGLDNKIKGPFTPGSFKGILSNHTVSVSKYTDMAADKTGRLWICTDEGLISYNTSNNTFTPYTTSNALPAEAPSSIAIDKNDYIWLLYPGQLVAFDQRKNKSRTFNYKNGFEGSPDGCHLLINNAGDLRIAYENHVEAINGDLFACLTDTMPGILITKVQSGDDLIPIFDSAGKFQTVHVSYRNNRLVFEFALPLYHNPDEIEYSYMAEGFDKNWVQAGNTHIANYTNLAGGQYIFKIRAFDPLSGKYSPVTNIAIVVHPPFWETWWFIILAILTVFTLIYIIYRYRLHQLFRMEKMRTSISNDLHDEIGATLTSISIYSNVAKKMSEIDSEKSKAYLEKIEVSSREMIDSMGDIVWSINPANDMPEKMLHRMRSYAYEITGASDIQLHWKENAQLEKQKMTMEQRKNFYLFFKEGMNNATKYSNADDIFVELDITQHDVSITIRDNGKGFETSGAFNGNGLKNMQARAGILKGTFTLTSSPGTGTYLYLTFPV